MTEAMGFGRDGWGFVVITVIALAGGGCSMGEGTSDTRAQLGIGEPDLPGSGSSGGEETEGEGSGDPEGGTGTSTSGADESSGSDDDAEPGTTGGEGEGLSECPSEIMVDSPGAHSDDDLDEISGLAASRAAPGLLWAHNDGGDTARVFVLELDGTLRNTLPLPGVQAIDFEDIAIGPGPAAGRDYVYVGDIGDNDEDRPYVSVHRFAEPLDPASAAMVTDLETFDFTYPDGSHDAETLFVDPADGALYVVVESPGGASLYRAPMPLASGDVLEALGDLEGAPNPTAGDVSPRGDFIIVRGLDHARLWLRAPGQSVADALGQSPCVVDLEDEVFGASLAILPDGYGYVTTSESVDQPIWRFEF